jgi:hypothetical protein
MPDADDLSDTEYASIYGRTALHARLIARLAAHLRTLDEWMARLDAILDRQQALIARLDTLDRTREGAAPG